jgi:hypothetical protein
MRPWLLLPALVLSAAPSSAQDKDGFKINPEVNQVKVEQAIARGIAFLKTSDSPDSAIGSDSDELKLLTFVHGGVPESEPVFQDLLKKCLDRKPEKTYRVSLLAMCLEEIDRVKYQDQIALCGQFLLDNVKSNGGFGYGEPTSATPEAGSVATRKDAFKPKKPPGPIDPNEKIKPEVTKHVHLKKSKDGPEALRSDNSNSQYGALGIRACHDAGIVFPKDVIEKCHKYWVNNQRTPQNADPKAKNVASGGKAGYGWCYSEGEPCSKNGPPYSSMTAGAVSALCIYDYILGKDWKKDKTVLDGMNWLDTNYSVTQNVGPCEIAPVPDGWLYYYLYALERTGLLYDTALIGKHDWYLDGYKVLLGAQKGNGSWDASHFIKPTWDTCFAILFLKRSTRPLVASTVERR